MSANFRVTMVRIGPKKETMRPFGFVFLVLGLAMALAARAGEPVLRPLTGGALTNLVRNPGFELRNAAGTAFTSWSAAPQGYRVAAGEGRSGSVAMACEAATASGWRGASQVLNLNRSSIAPLTVRGWSRAEAVSGGADSEYALYVDVVYADGTPLWGQTGNFSTGTHDWERQEFTIVPAKPIRTLSLYCLFRGNHSGKVWFDDIEVEEQRTSGAALLFQGSVMETVSSTNPAPTVTSTVSTEDGLRLQWAGQRMVSMQVDGRDVTSSGAGGFLARDVASGSGVYRFEDGVCAELGLRLEASVTARADHVAIEGRVVDTTGVDRAIQIFVAAPVEATGWQWWQDIRGSSKIEGRDEFANVTSVRAGGTGTMSTYPLAAISQDAAGLGLGLDMGHPSLYRLVYHAGTRQLFAVCDFGLVRETERFPGAADFRFVLFRFDGRGGFRAAWAKYQQLFPDHFAVRSKSQGIWMPFTDISTVSGWEDFGFRYQEGAPNIPFDDRNGILSFRYTEPMTWWMPMSPERPRTIDEALKVREEYAQGAAGNHQRMAVISQSAAMNDAKGQPALLFRNEPWANGAVWSLNPNPHLPADPNAASVYWNESYRTKTYGSAPPSGLDGEYLDSLEGYVTADLNFRRDHFRWTTVPLTFSSDTKQPVLFKGLAVYEFTRWISEDVHRLGRLMFANGVPYRFGYLCPWLDVMGTETDWLSGGAYQPSSHAQMSYWRTMSGAKPYLLLMNTDYNAFAAHVERYFRRCLFYGFYPSMFSHNASENPYWRNPAWYNRDRPLFKKYLPVIRTVAEAGWQPVTGATCDNPAIAVERFGPDAAGARYYTLYSESARAESGLLIENGGPGGVGGPGEVATEILSGGAVRREAAGWRISLEPQGVGVLKVQSGPRFRSASRTADDGIRLTIESPLRLAQVLESAPDLKDWQPRLTNEPLESPYVVDLPRSTGAGGEVFRLRH
ncbi:MAG: hypothetical protein IT581_20965 [Verrucomicrobiales bacterium]|nr:hypothetical protein [Verrucomicrobiales bacterium]